MKTLEEKKLLVKMAKMLGQPIDQELVESIRREEELIKLLFKEEVKEVETQPVVEQVLVEEPLMLIEADPAEPIPPTPPAATVPSKENLISQTINLLSTARANTSNANNNIYRDKEIEGIRKTLAEMMQKITTLSWGGGGTGIVRIWNADDFDRNSAGNGKYMKYQDGWFVLDEINPYEIVHNATLVTTNTYVVQDSDYYIGVNHAGPVTIVVPSEPTSGRELVIKDESGNCEIHNISVVGPVDNDENGFILAVNNGAVHMLFRGDYWRII